MKILLTGDGGGANASTRFLLRAMDPTEAAWLACAIESEGWISISKAVPERNQWIRLSVGTCNTDRGFVARAQEIVGRYAISLPIKQNNREGRKPMYRWVARHHIIIEWMLESILPYMVTKKKEKAVAMLNFIRGRTWGNTPESTRKRSESLKRSWQNPEIREKRLAGMKKRWSKEVKSEQ